MISLWPGHPQRVYLKRVGTIKHLPTFSNSMNTTIDAPVEWVETIGQLRLPSKADDRLQQLMDRNNEGELAAGEREELESLVELSERLSLVRAEALLLLGRRPT